MRKTLKTLTWILSAAAGGAVMVAVGVFFYLFEQLEGFYAPVYDPGGHHVYFVARETTGITWGPGWEFFTAPAVVYTFSDALSLRRLDRDTGTVETLEVWSTSPIDGRVVHNYRGRLFQVLNVQLRIDRVGRVDYEISMNTNEPPISESYRIGGFWSAEGGRRGQWEKGRFQGGGYDVTPLFGESELMTAPGRETYPAAVISYNEVRKTTTALVKSAEFDSRYPSGMPVKMAGEQSHRAAIERLTELKRLHAALIAQFEAMGQTAMQAGLSAIKELQRLGYYPKSPTITARLVAPPATEKDGGPALFDIAKFEMKSGIFPDIEKAIAAPGTDVEWRDNKYIVHTDYTTSARLNAYLAAGNRVFRVRFGGAVYELSIVEP